MGMCLFYLGGALCLAGLARHLLNVRLALRIVRRTAGRADGLKRGEALWNTQLFKARDKLEAIVESDPDPRLRDDARRVLRGQAIVGTLFLSGMLWMAVGAGIWRG